MPHIKMPSHTNIELYIHTHATYFHTFLLLRVSMLSWRIDRDVYEVPSQDVTLLHRLQLFYCYYSLNAWNVRGSVLWSLYDKAELQGLRDWIVHVECTVI